MIYDEIVALAKELPGVEESTSYGTPALKVRGKLLVRLREDGDTVVLACEPDERELLVAAEPETFFFTDHYRGYPLVLVRFAEVNPGAFRDLFERAWRRVAGKKLIAQLDGTS